MPKVTRTSDGTQFTSHWLASPIKYMTPAPALAFASRFGVELITGGIISPCGACHGGNLSRMKAKAERIQDDTYASALVVQSALMDSLTAIRRAKEAQAAGQNVSQTLLDTAADEHRAAHVRWENLIVSENSMGFHNPTEVSAELTTALGMAQSARLDAEAATPAICLADTSPPALSGSTLPALLWPRRGSCRSWPATRRMTPLDRRMEPRRPT
jgi:nitrite reductase (cytochrome c-552)